MRGQQRAMEQKQQHTNFEFILNIINIAHYINVCMQFYIFIGCVDMFMCFECDVRDKAIN